MSKLELRTRHVGSWGMNTYALVCLTSGESVLIDPGDDVDKLQEMLAGSKPIAILLTHSHIDHIGALAEMREALQVPLVAHKGPHAQGRDLSEDQWLGDGDTFQVGEHTLKVFHTPGHISDQICFAIEEDNRIVVGDTIFEGGPGRTWNSADFQTTLHTLRNIVLAWPDDTVCYPGHGSSFRLGDKRAEIEAFLAKDHGDFYGDAEWGMSPQKA